MYTVLRKIKTSDKDSSIELFQKPSLDLHPHILSLCSLDFFPQSYKINPRLFFCYSSPFCFARLLKSAAFNTISSSRFTECNVGISTVSIKGFLHSLKCLIQSLASVCLNEAYESASIYSLSFFYCLNTIKDQQCLIKQRLW